MILIFFLKCLVDSDKRKIYDRQGEEGVQRNANMGDAHDPFARYRSNLRRLFSYHVI